MGGDPRGGRGMAHTPDWESSSGKGFERFKLRPFFGLRLLRFLSVPGLVRAGRHPALRWLVPVVEELHGALVLFGFLAGLECTQVAALAGPLVHLPRVE